MSKIWDKHLNDNLKNEYKDSKCMCYLKLSKDENDIELNKCHISYFACLYCYLFYIILEIDANLISFNDFNLNIVLSKNDDIYITLPCNGMLTCDRMWHQINALECRIHSIEFGIIICQFNQ